MRNFKKTIPLFLLILLFSLQGIGQNNTSSPYSRFGIGDIAQQGFSRNQAMGGLGIALRSDRTLNNINPASYTAMDSMSFIMEFGGKANLSRFKTNSQPNYQNNSDVNFDYLAFAFPVTKWWGASFGLSHLSDVGYQITQIEESAQGDNSLSQYQGTGGLNRVYMSNGFKPINNFSVGFTVNYVFGSLEQNKSVIFDNTFSSPIMGREEAQVSDFTWEFGAQYESKINDHYDLVVGAIFSSKTKMRSDYTNLITRNTNFINGQSTSTIIDTLISVSEKRDLGLPLTYGMGFVVTKDKKLSMGFDYRRENWSKTNFLGQAQELVNSDNFALGMEYIPNANAVRGYFNRVSYRMGAHYNNSYLKIRGEQLKDYGISLGAAFPLPRLATRINIGMELGRRGTLTNNLIREDYVKFSLSFSLFEHWFVKRRFD